jgi:TonB family protein
MSAMESWTLGYLLNALWQGLLLYVAALALARTVRRLGPQMEHRVWCVALVAQALMPAPLVWPKLVWWRHAGAANGLVTIVTGDGIAKGGLRMPHRLLETVAFGYGALLLLLGARLAWTAWRTFELGRRAEPLALEGEAAGVWRRTCRRFDICGAQIRVSDQVNGPVAIGIWRLMVIFPRGFVGHVSSAELAAAMAHECAHMQRHDFGKNLLYEVLRLPVAWHPAAWSVRARMAESREIVCDALAADAMAGRQAYARALLQLASTMVERTPQPNLQTIGIFDANRLEDRVMRLTEKRFEVQGARRLAMVALCVAAGLGTLATAAELRVSVAVPASAPVGAQTGAVDGTRAMRVSGGVMAGNILSKTQPVYPQEAKDAGVEGAVVLHATIGKDGTIAQLVVISGPEELQASALDAVKHWLYKPFLLNGEPTEVETTIEVNYSLAK